MSANWKPAPGTKAQINKLDPDGNVTDIAEAIKAISIAVTPIRQAIEDVVELMCEAWANIERTFRGFAVSIDMDLTDHQRIILGVDTPAEVLMRYGFTEADCKRYDSATQTLWTHGHRWVHLPTGRKGTWALPPELQTGDNQ